MREPSQVVPRKSEGFGDGEMRPWSSGAATPLNKGPSPGTGGQCAAESLGAHKYFWDTRSLSEQKHGFGEESGKAVINVAMLYSL